MALYTIVAWSAIVIVGGAYYWIYIRQVSAPVHVLRFTQLPALTTDGGNPLRSPRKRKRKEATQKSQPALSEKTKGPLNSVSPWAEESDGYSTRVQERGRAFGESETLRTEKDIRRLQDRGDVHSTPSDADESDALDTPTSAHWLVQGNLSDTSSVQRKTAAESRFGKVIAKTTVDDMLPPEERPLVSRVLRITLPTQEKPEIRIRPSEPRSDPDIAAGGKDGLSKKQRQNRKKKERYREARAREETVRLENLRAHQKQLETVRINKQFEVPEKRSAWREPWSRSGKMSLVDSAYTVQNISEENLTTVGLPSDGAGSEEGWQEVTSRAAKRAVSQKVMERNGSCTDRSEDVSCKDDAGDTGSRGS